MEAVKKKRHCGEVSSISNNPSLSIVHMRLPVRGWPMSTVRWQTTADASQ